MLDLESSEWYGKKNLKNKIESESLVPDVIYDETDYYFKLQEEAILYSEVDYDGLEETKDN